MAKPIPHGTASGYVYHKCRCEICKSAESERKKRWREANPDHRRKSWEANKARDSEKNRIWREANPDYRRRHYEANREKAAEDTRRWRAANPEKITALRAASNHRRRARHRGALVEDVPRLEIFERDDWQCQVAGCLYPGIPASLDVDWPDPLFASLDHVIPLARGGTHERSNLVTAHLRCNLTKGARESIA